MYYGLHQGVSLYSKYWGEKCDTQKNLSVTFIISENLEQIGIRRCN
jgi:hypothetical protein